MILCRKLFLIAVILSLRSIFMDEKKELLLSLFIPVFLSWLPCLILLLKC